jgi:hypothetical protein
MLYFRIPRSKFWGWVVVSMLVGLAIGLVIMLVRTAGLSSQITVLQNRVNAASAGVSGTSSAAEASVTALTGQNAALTSQLAAAQAQIAALKKGTTASTTSTGAIAVVSRVVSPSTVATAGTITLTVKVTGHPASVTMRVYTSSKSFDTTYSLKRVASSGNSETWRLVTKASTRTGTYHYYATAIRGSTRVTMPGASPRSFTVQ